jgi:hypothetical protein
LRSYSRLGKLPLVNWLPAVRARVSSYIDVPILKAPNKLDQAYFYLLKKIIFKLDKQIPLIVMSTPYRSVDIVFGAAHRSLSIHDVPPSAYYYLFLFIMVSYSRYTDITCYIATVYK